MSSCYGDLGTECLAGGSWFARHFIPRLFCSLNLISPGLIRMLKGIHIVKKLALCNLDSWMNIH